VDFYEILGVAKTATAAEVRQGYLKIARERHPDRFQDPAEKQNAQEFFKQATEAFNTLSNEKSRQQYDADLDKPKLSGPAEMAADAYQRAAERMQAGDFQEAMNLLRAAVHHAPDDHRYHAALAKVLLKNPHWSREALGELETAVRLDPGNAGYHFAMAQVLVQQGLRLRARRCIEAALKIAPRHPEIQRLAIDLGAGGPEPAPPPGPPGGLLDKLRRKP
jgi:curved DNA-binding protein CbpA